MKGNIKVAVVQYKIINNCSSAEKKISSLIKKAKDNNVDIVGLPEECLGKAMRGYDPFDFLSKISKRYKVMIFGATYFYDEVGRIRNIGFLYDNKGEMLIQQDKIVLTPPALEAGFKAGNKIKVINTKFGKISLLICKDAFHRYAAWLFNALMKENVDIVLVPSSSITVSERSTNLWTDTLKTMSMLFNLFIVASGTVGINGIDGSKAFGNAIIISPKKVLLAQGSVKKEEILYATLDKEDIENLKNPASRKWQPEKVPSYEIVEL